MKYLAILLLTSGCTMHIKEDVAWSWGHEACIKNEQIVEAMEASVGF